MRKLRALLPWADDAIGPLKATDVDAAEWFFKFLRFETHRLLPAKDIAASDPAVPLGVFLQHYRAFVKWRERREPKNENEQAFLESYPARPRDVSLEVATRPELAGPQGRFDCRRLRKELPEEFVEIIDLVAKGLHNNEIANFLKVPPSRVIRAVRKAKLLSGARDRLGIALAWRNIQPDCDCNWRTFLHKTEKRLLEKQKTSMPVVEQYYISRTGIAVVLSLDDLIDLMVKPGERTWPDRVAKREAYHAAWKAAKAQAKADKQSSGTPGPKRRVKRGKRKKRRRPLGGEGPVCVREGPLGSC